MLRAQHRIVRSSKSSACLGVSKPRTKQNPAENYWWFMLTHTGREFILDSDGKVFLHTWEDLFSQIGECTTTLAYLWELWSRSSCKNCILLDSQQEYTFAKSLQCLWSVLVPSRQSRGWLGWRRYFGFSQTGQIDWFLPINWFRTHTHTQNSIFFTLHITRSETAANPERYLNRCYLDKPQQWQFMDFSGLLETLVLPLILLCPKRCN